MFRIVAVVEIVMVIDSGFNLQDVAYGEYFDFFSNFLYLFEGGIVFLPLTLLIMSEGLGFIYLLEIMNDGFFIFI